MLFKNPLIVVRDMERSIAFYREVLGLGVEQDFGANVTLEGGVCLQTLESWLGFTGASPERLAFGGIDAELYFEEADFTAFAARLASAPGVEYLHPPMEHRWGQRAVRFFDPDRHVIEVGEAMDAVCRRFVASGLTIPQTAARMDVPEAYVRALLG